MTGRDDFTTDEWRTLVGTPGVVMFAVVVTSYGGIRRELKSIRRTLRNADDFPAETELVAHVAGTAAMNARRLVRDGAAGDLHREVARARANDSCRAAMSILRAKATPAERDEYGRFVLYCAGQTAFAGRDSGLPGLGPRISSAERRFLESLATTLDVDDRPDQTFPRRWWTRGARR